MIQKLLSVKLPDKREVFQLVPLVSKYELPEKIYGNLYEKAVHAWNVFAAPNGKAGVLVTGRAGNSKTTFCKLLCNIAVDMGTPVIAISEQEVTPEMVNYLSNLNNCVIFIDEFGKVVGYDVQKFFLSLLSDSNKKRMFLLSDNDSYSINRFILNRPERVRYHFEFDGIENTIIKEYCKDYNVPEDFVKELIRINMLNNRFCFDHLRTLVGEAILTNNWDIEYLIDILNVKVLKSKPFYIPVKVDTIDKPNRFLSLSPDLLAEGLVVIPIKDIEYTKYKNTKKPTESIPTNSDDPMADLGFPKPKSNTNIVLTPDLERLYQEKEKLEEEIKEAYQEVELDIARDRDDYYRRSTPPDTSKCYIKVNLNPDYIVDVYDDIQVYTDTTGRFRAHIRKTTKRF